MIRLWSEITSGSRQSGNGHICFTKPFLIKMGCEISGWRFLKLWFFYVRFYCISWYYESLKFPIESLILVQGTLPLYTRQLVAILLAHFRLVYMTERNWCLCKQIYRSTN